MKDSIITSTTNFSKIETFLLLQFEQRYEDKIDKLLDKFISKPLDLQSELELLELLTKKLNPISMELDKRKIKR